MTTLGEVAVAANAHLQGCDAATVITGVAPLSGAEPSQISFLTHPRYRPFLTRTRAAAVILSPEDAADCPVPALVAANPHIAYARAAALFARENIDVVPAPTGYSTSSPSMIDGLLPTASALDRSRQALHEWLGILVNQIF